MKQILTWLDRNPEIEVCALYSTTFEQVTIHMVLDEDGNSISVTLDEEEGLMEEIVLTENGLVDEEYFYYLRDNTREPEFEPVTIDRSFQ